MRKLLIIWLLAVVGLVCHAQTDSLRTMAIGNDSTFVISSDSALLRDLAPLDTVAAPDSSLHKALQMALNEEPAKPRKKRDWSTWTPNPKRALWLALVIPGGGQIYNRKYWKLPIIYGGFMGCIYALTWNNMMYKDYSQAYLDIMDDDPGTASYNQFLHLGRQITDSNIERYKSIFKSRKDRFRRYRDLSVFVLIGVYALSIVDAYVDASLSEFDISDNLSLHIQPAVFGNQAQGKPQQPAGVGLGIGLTF